MEPEEDIIDADQLRAFEAVAKTKSSTKAAGMLGNAQSSVSQQIARLEGRLGRLLVRRTTRRVELTPAGDAMLVYVRSILAMTDDVRSWSLDRSPSEVSYFQSRRSGGIIGSGR
jgi:DNA-binding transcriptional LysR family regulator